MSNDSQPEISLETLIPSEWKGIPGSPKTVQDMVNRIRKVQGENDTLKLRVDDAEANKAPELKSIEEIHKHYGDIFKKEWDDIGDKWDEMAKEALGGDEKFKEFKAIAEKKGLDSIIGLADKKQIGIMRDILVGKVDGDNNSLPDNTEIDKKQSTVDAQYTYKFGTDTFACPPTRKGIRDFANQQVIDPETKKPAILIDIDEGARDHYHAILNEATNNGTSGPSTNTEMVIKKDGTVVETATTGDFEEEFDKMGNNKS